MASKPREGRSASLVIKETQVRHPVSYRVTTTRMAVLSIKRKGKEKKGCLGCGEVGPRALLVGM